MYRNGRKIKKKDFENKKKKDKEIERKKKNKKKRLKKRKQKRKEIKNKRTKGTPKQRTRKGGSPLGDGGNNNPLGEDGQNNPLDDGMGGNPLDDGLGGVPYPDINDKEINPLEDEEEEKESVAKRTFRRVKDAAKKSWKWLRRLRHAGMALSFVSAFAIPIIIIGLLFVFVVVPLTVVMLPTGVYVAIDDGEDDGDSGSGGNEKEEHTGKGRGGLIDAETDEEFMEGSSWPSDKANYVTSLPGNRASPGGIGSTDHKGIDIARAGGAEGLNILSYQGGKVVHVQEGCVVGTLGCGGGYGNYVKVQHSDKYETLYAHMKEVKVKVGDEVSSGELLGLIGDTGQSDGAHLHFEVHVNGEKHNPAPYLKKFGNEGLQLE